jgi:ABC-type glutathione transport system ATPase component
MTEQQVDEKAPVLKLENVAVAYKVRGGEIEAVQDVSFGPGHCG